MQRLFIILQTIAGECKTNAAILSLLLIIVIEVSLHSHLVNNFFSHEVDWTLLYLGNKGLNQPVVALGDSVGHGIFSGWRLDIAPLACNQATEITGQYFFLKRFLANNKTPGAVINSELSPLGGNLNQRYTENYIQRCFSRWSEIYELLLVKKNPAFTAKMIAYKFLATYKYRLHLQKHLVGFTNSNIYSGVSEGKTGKARHGIVKILSKKIKEFRKESISLHFFKKMLAELETLHVPLYYLPPPTRSKNRNTQSMVIDSLHQMKKLQSQFTNLEILATFSRQMPKKYFRDTVHLNPEGLNMYRQVVQGAVDTIVSNAVSKQHDLFETSFQGGTEVFDFTAKWSSKRIKPLHDTTILVKNKQLIVQAHGNDPALLITDTIKGIGNHGKTMVVKITLDSEVKTVASLFYSQDGQPFSEKHCLKKNVIVGQNKLFFIFPEKLKQGQLRFDPGEKQGKYVLHAISGRSVPIYLTY